MFTRELGLLNEVSELCGKKKNGTPNISVFDLQHLSKERNQVLLLAGRLKPAIVELIDIGKLDNERFRELGFHTPLRIPRYKLDFSDMPAAIREELAVPLKQLLERSEKDNDVTDNPFVKQDTADLFQSGKLDGLFTREAFPNSIHVSDSSLNDMFTGSDVILPKTDPNPERDALIDKIMQRRDELVSKDVASVVEP